MAVALSTTSCGSGGEGGPVFMCDIVQCRATRKASFMVL